MENFEKVEKLKEKAGVTYEEAKNALEASNWDILDAMIYLEKLGKVSGPTVESYTTKPEMPQDFSNVTYEYEQSYNKGGVGDALNKFFIWCGDVIKKSCENFFEVKRFGNIILSVPVIVLILLLIFAFWVVIPLIVVGFFFDFKYSFRGSLKCNEDLNQASDNIANGCEGIKDSFKNNNNN